MGLRDKYAHAIQTAKGRFQGNAEEREGRLYWKGTVESDADKNLIWDAIKTVPDWQKEIVADIGVKPPAPAPARTYTVKAGDTLGKIAQQLLGSANRYMEIFNLNKDQLSNPDVIKPGQKLRIPK